MKKKIVRIVVFLAVFIVLAGLAFQNADRIRSLWKTTPRELTLTGNVDDRGVNLAFIVPERVADVAVEEGDSVRKGDLLASLETVRIENNLAEAESVAASAQAAYDKAVNGYRKEEIAMAEAGVNIIKAQIEAAENKSRRNRELAEKNAASQQDADDAVASHQKLLAELDLAEENLKRMLAGTRAEEIAGAKAKLGQAQAALAAARQTLSDTKLFAPCDGIIRSRVLEPGEMASPQKTAIQMAVISPKWVRVYLAEPLLTLIKPGDRAVITLDGSEKTLNGWVGFLSPNAEFTPKNVETKELRTSLVYEVRVYVRDPENILKLGSPAVVTFPGVMVTE